MSERAEWQRMLAEAEARLASLPRAHEVRYQHSVLARRIALEAKIASLRRRIEADLART